MNKTIGQLKVKDIKTLVEHTSWIQNQMDCKLNEKIQLKGELFRVSRSDVTNIACESRLE